MICKLLTRRSSIAVAAVVFASMTPSAGSAAAFTEGNLVVYRVGAANDGTNPADVGEPVIIDEYSPSGTLIQSIAMPTATVGNKHRLVASGSESAAGLLNRSPDGQWLTFLGYDAALGSTSPHSRSPSDVRRVIARMDGEGNLDTSTALNDLGFGNGNIARSSITTDGSRFLVTSGAGPVRQTYLGQSVSTAFSHQSITGRHIDVFDNRVFVSTGDSQATSAIAEINQTTGLPSYLPGLPDPDPFHSVSQFWMADLSMAVPGVDVLYTTDIRTLDNTGGIRKYSLVGGTWTDNGRIAGPSSPFIWNFQGLTGAVDNGEVTLFGTQSSSLGSSLVSFIDVTGYNGACSGTATVLANASANTRFRGVDFTPLAATTEIAGDFDGNGVVEGPDLVQWRGDYGPTPGSDADNDGDSDGNDFLIWQRALDQGGLISVIPEPSSILIASLSAIGLILTAHLRCHIIT